MCFELQSSAIRLLSPGTFGSGNSSKKSGRRGNHITLTGRIVATPVGIEPTTSSLEGWRSIQLSYGVVVPILAKRPPAAENMTRRLASGSPFGQKALLFGSVPWWTQAQTFALPSEIPGSGGYSFGTERFRLTFVLLQEVYTGCVASSAPSISLSLNDARESRVGSRVLPQAPVDTAGVRSIRIKSYRSFEKRIQ
jgi:hypothetical protein